MILTPPRLNVCAPTGPITLEVSNRDNKRTAFSCFYFFRYVKQTFEKFSKVTSLPVTQGIVVPSFVLQKLQNQHF
jgi:hypothetical protein